MKGGWAWSSSEEHFQHISSSAEHSWWQAGSSHQAADGQVGGEVTPGYQQTARTPRAPLCDQQKHQTAARLCLSAHHKPFITPVGFCECFFLRCFEGMASPSSSLQSEGLNWHSTTQTLHISASVTFWTYISGLNPCLKRRCGHCTNLKLESIAKDFGITVAVMTIESGAVKAEGKESNEER